MGKVVLYIAMSLDGYIADKDGGVAWLEGDGSDQANTGTYDEFIKTVETVILGYTTYHQVVTELSKDVWFYENQMTYVLTHKVVEDKPNIKFTSEPLVDLLTRLKQTQTGDIWICGGASIVNQALNHRMIDQYRIAIMPTVLGDGIPLFDSKETTLLKLVETHTYNGMVELVYENR